MKKYELTAAAAEHVAQGERFCTGCGKIKPLAEFYQHNKRNASKTSFRSHCKTCIAHGQKNALRRRYYANKAIQDAEILAQKVCEVCGQPGELYFWRNLESRDVGRWAVLHHECKAEAVATGILESSRCRLRPIESLNNTTRQTLADLDARFPEIPWNERAKALMAGPWAKECNHCHEVLSLDNFPVCVRRGKKHITGSCFACRNAKARAYEALRKSRGEK